MKMGVGVPLAVNSWIGLLAWFPTPVRLSVGLGGCLDSPVSLSRWLGLAIIFRCEWSYELAPLLL